VEIREAAERILGAHLKLVVGTVLVAITAAVLLHLNNVSLYTASVRLSLDTPDPQTAAAAGANADTARAIVTSPGLVARSLAAAGVPNVSEESSTEFAEKDVKVQGLGSANVIQLSVTYPEARTAALIANQLASGLIKARLEATRGRLSQLLAGVDEQVKVLDQRITQLRAGPAADSALGRAQLAEVIRERSDLASERESILVQDSLRPQPSIVDQARAPAAPDPSRAPQDIALSALLGLITSVGLASVMESFSPTLVGADAVAREVGAPVLAELPRPNGNVTSFQRELQDRHVRLAVGFARMGAVELADLGPLTISTDVALIASRLSDPMRAARVLVTAGEPLEVRAIRRSRSSSNGGRIGATGLVLVAPAVIKRRDFLWVAKTLETQGQALLGVVTYPPSGRWRAVKRRISHPFALKKKRRSSSR
jgi:capsular polysaccharide biosynthesis protein